MRDSQGFTILLVDDDLDFREALAELLAGEGYSVRQAANAEEGLQALRQGSLDLVISDYRMPPGENGAWMLKEATSEHLLASTQVLLLTAEETIEGLDGVKRLRKPIDSDVLLAEVAVALGPLRTAQLALAITTLLASADANPAATTRALTLFLDSAAPASIRSVNTLRELLKEFELTATRVTIWDISKAPPPDLHEPITLIPTLVWQSGDQEARLAGELHREAVTALLVREGAQRKPA